MIRIRDDLGVFDIVEQIAVCIECFLRFPGFSEGKAFISRHSMARIMQDGWFQTWLWIFRQARGGLVGMCVWDSSSFALA